MNSYAGCAPVLALGLLVLSGLVLFAVGDTAAATVNAVASAVAAGDLADGGAFTRFDTEMERSHPLRDVAIPAVAAVRYIALRQGNSGVVVGRNGWLFTDEEFQHHSEDERALRERLAYIREVADLLEHTHSADLAVVVVPSKARVAAEYVPRYMAPAVFHDRLRRTVEELRESRITVVNAADALTPEDYFFRDTHWNPDGTERTARAVGTAVGDSERFGSTYRLSRLEAEVLEGDLLPFVPVGLWSEALGLTRERYRPLEADLVDGASGGGGLFDTPEIPVTLVGTSYSADQRFGFEIALRVVLGADVLNVAEPAGGPFRPMAAYLKGDTLSEISPELVVWEIPERYLTLPGVDVPTPPDTVALDDRPR
ncbi:MAG: hypothetical protein WD492_12170 [Alkalispirochaeta sp.]